MDAIARPRRGFSLVELLIVLAIAGSLWVAGMPAFGRLLGRARIANAEVLLTNNLQAARSAAVFRNTRIVVCPTGDGRHCEAGADWQHGWLIAEDGDHDGQPDAGVPLLATQPALVQGTRIVTSAGRHLVAFQPTGSAGGSNVRFTICRAHGAAGQSVVIANSGRIRTDVPAPDRLRQCLAGLR